ncbi:MAG: hypothetical protein VR75_09170 [Hyphomonadaceae bacterium BRH_c29]|nr:MAG: hypothetical protein VR75_09170 [Hyphomonadaceae bacterium BRH_c29]
MAALLRVKCRGDTIITGLAAPMWRLRWKPCSVFRSAGMARVREQVHAIQICVGLGSATIILPESSACLSMIE